MADDVRETNGLGIDVGLASDLVHIIPHCCRVRIPFKWWLGGVPMSNTLACHGLQIHQLTEAEAEVRVQRLDTCCSLQFGLLDRKR